MNDRLRELIAKWRDDKIPACTCPKEGHFHKNDCPRYLWNQRRQSNQGKYYADELEALLASEMPADGDKHGS